MFCLKRGVKLPKEDRKPLPASSSIGSLDDLLTDGNASFLRAARAGNIEKVLEYLKGNIDINTSNANGLNALHLASKEGHVGVVTELLKRGANVNAATKKGNTALHIASLAGQDEVVKVLVHLGANVNVQSQNGFTPLYMAAQENHDGVVSFLLGSGANQSLATEDGFTPLAVALQQGHDKVVAVLLENDTKGRVRLPALHIAAKKDDCKAAALLLQNDHNPDVTSKSGFTPLHIAAHYGNENIANLLLEKGADVNYAAKHQITPLHVASKWGKANMVTLLTDKGARIESSTRDGLTPLHCAARSGHDQVVDLLLNKGAPMLAKTKNGLAPLHMASQGDHVDSAHILLGHKAPVDDVTVDYLTALHVAAHCGHVKVAKLLLDSKADPNARALNGFTPLHIACKKNRIKVVELLLKYGASIEATTESGLTPLHVASFMGCMNIVIYLIQNGANPDVPTVRGETPLHLAARANQTDIIRILLRNGANVDARAREEQTPLHIAARLGNVDIVSLLLQHGAAVDATTKDMYTALHIAAKEDQEEVASVLLDHGASLTATTKKGFTPLHLAAKYGNIKVARLLLQKDAPVDAQGKNGVTPLHVAAHYDNVNVALLLLDKGASPHAMAKNGYTPLHIAAKKNQMDIATTLLEYGAKANSESKAGFTPLHLASQEGHTDMTTLLIEHQGDVNFSANNGLTPLHLCAQDDRVNVAAILVKNGAKIGPQTKAGYTPLHVASHFGQINMVRFLLQHSADVHMTTSHGYTPLHQAAQQGHTPIVNLLLENEASPNVTTSQGQTALSIAQRLGYISVVETLKVVTETTVTTTTTTVTEEKYKVVAPETMQETFMTDSEDEGGEDTMLGDQSYRYLTADEMKSLGDDSLPIDVTKDEKHESMILSKESPAPMVEEDHISPQHITPVEIGFSEKFSPDNVDISHAPVHAGFLVSFMVDARGGAMRGCRHSGVRVIIPPRKAPMPMRITCRYLRKEKLIHPPPLMEGEACASRILEVGPVGARFLGPVIIEVPHFASLRGKEREITILRSDDGDSWREHTLEASEEAVQEVLNESFEGEELSALEDLNTSRITRILTTDFPQYFAIITRIRQEVHAVGPEGGMVSSTVVPQVQAIFSQGALTKKIRVGLQAQPISPELVAKLLGNRVAVSPIVTVEPRRRKFHKPITLTIPVPQAATKGMINQYSGDAPTLRLLCSITGGSSKAQWEDVTGSTPLTLVNDCVSFTTTVSARFWLMDCRVNEATKFATELYQEAVHVPFMAKFVVFAKRHDPNEAQLRVFCMTDDKEDKTLETQEHFTEIAKSRDVEVLENKLQYLEFAGNLVPVTKSGEQLKLTFQAFRENRLPFTIRVKDPHVEPLGRIAFMKEPKVGRGEPPQTPICNLNVSMPEVYMSESTPTVSELVTLEKRYDFIQEAGLSKPESIHRADLRLSDIARELDKDWVALAQQLDVSETDINIAKNEYPDDISEQALTMLRFWLQKSGSRATGNELEKGLRKINREDIIKKCMFNVELVTDVVEKAVAKVHLDQSGFDIFKEELGSSREASMRRGASLDASYDEQDIMKEAESAAETSSETGSLFERDQISQALSEDKENIPQLYEDVVVNNKPYIQGSESPVILENIVLDKQNQNHEALLSNEVKIIVEKQDMVMKTDKENGLQESVHEKTGTDYYDLNKVNNNNIKNVCDFTALPEHFTTYKSEDITVLKGTKSDTCDSQENGDFELLQEEKALSEVEADLISNEHVYPKNALHEKEDLELLSTHDNFMKETDAIIYTDTHKLDTNTEGLKSTEYISDEDLVLGVQDNEIDNTSREQKEKYFEHSTSFVSSEIVHHSYDDSLTQSDSAFKTVSSDFHEMPNSAQSAEKCISLPVTTQFSELKESHEIYEHNEPSGLCEAKTDLKTVEMIFQQSEYLCELPNVKELEKESEITTGNNMLGEAPLVAENSQIFQIQSEVNSSFSESQRASENTEKQIIQDSYKIKEVQQNIENEQNMNLVKDVSQTSDRTLEPARFIEEVTDVLKLDKPLETGKVTCAFEEMFEVEKKAKEPESLEVVDSPIINSYSLESHGNNVSEGLYLEQLVTEQFENTDISALPETFESMVSNVIECGNMHSYTENAKLTEESRDMPCDILEVTSCDQPTEYKNEEGNKEIPSFSVITDSIFQNDIYKHKQEKGAENSPFSTESAHQYNLSSYEVPKLEEIEILDYEIIQDDTMTKMLKTSESEMEASDTLIDEILYKKGEIIDIDQFSIIDNNSCIQDLVNNESFDQVLKIDNVADHTPHSKDIKFTDLESENHLSSKDDKITESCGFSAAPYTLNATEAKICKVSRTPPPSPAEIIDKVPDEHPREIEEPSVKQITVETYEVIADDAVIKQVTTSIVKSNEAIVPAEVEVAPLEIQELTPKLTESETWPSGEMDTSQVSVSSLPDDEKSEPTTATVSSATTAEADVDTKVQEDTKEWTEMDASGTTRHVIQKTTHMNLIMKQKSDDTSEEEVISRSSVPELPTTASESPVPVETADEEKQDLGEVALEEEVVFQSKAELEDAANLKQDDTKLAEEKEISISHSPLLDEPIIKEDYKDTEKDIDSLEQNLLAEEIRQDIMFERNVEKMEGFETSHSKIYEESAELEDAAGLKQDDTKIAKEKGISISHSPLLDEPIIKEDYKVTEKDIDSLEQNLLAEEIRQDIMFERNVKKMEGFETSHSKIYEESAELEDAAGLKQDDTKIAEEKGISISHSPLLDEPIIKEDYKDTEKDIDSMEKILLAEEIRQDIMLESNVEKMEAFETAHSKIYEEGIETAPDDVDEYDEIPLKSELETKIEECKDVLLDKAKKIDIEELSQHSEEARVSEIPPDQFVAGAVEKISDSEEITASEEDYDSPVHRDEVSKMTPFFDESKREKVIVQAECKEIMAGAEIKAVEAESIQEIPHPLGKEEEIILSSLEEIRNMDESADSPVSKDDEGKPLDTEPERKYYESAVEKDDVITVSSEEIAQFSKVHKESSDIFVSSEVLLPSEEPEEHSNVKDIKGETLYIDYKSVKDEVDRQISEAMKIIQDSEPFEKLPDDETITNSSRREHSNVKDIKEGTLYIDYKSVKDEVDRQISEAMKKQDSEPFEKLPDDETILMSLQKSEVHEFEVSLVDEKNIEDFKEEFVDVSSQKIAEAKDMIQDSTVQEESTEKRDEDYQSISVQEAPICEMTISKQFDDQASLNLDEKQIDSEQKGSVVETTVEGYVTESTEHFMEPIEISKDIKCYEIVDQFEEKLEKPEVSADTESRSKDIEDELEELAVLKEETPIIPADIKESILDVSEDSIVVITPELLETTSEPDVVEMDVSSPIKPHQGSLEEESTHIVYTYPSDELDTETSCLIETSTDEVTSGEPMDLKQLLLMQQETYKAEDTTQIQDIVERVATDPEGTTTTTIMTTTRVISLPTEHYRQLSESEELISESATAQSVRDHRFEEESCHSPHSESH